MAQIIKFGGTSLQTKETREKAYHIIEEKAQSGKVVVVVSAIGRIGDHYATDSLESLIQNYVSLKERDRLISMGEVISSIIICDELLERGLNCVSLPVHKIGIETDNNYGNAHITSVNSSHIRDSFQKYNVVIVPGFQGLSHEKEIATLGKGGSDLTCVVLATGLGMKNVEIYSNVSGIYTGDPKYINNVRLHGQVDYDDAILLSKHGAKVIQEKAVNIAKAFEIQLHLKSTFEKDGGTIITKTDKKTKGICCMENYRYIVFDQQITSMPFTYKMVNDKEYILSLNEFHRLKRMVPHLYQQIKEVYEYDLISLVNTMVTDESMLEGILDCHYIVDKVENHVAHIFVKHENLIKSLNTLHDVFVLEE